MAERNDPAGRRAEIEQALGVLAAQLRAHPIHQELLDIAQRMEDLPDELWLAVQILTMSEVDRAKLRDFLLVNPHPHFQRFGRSTLVLTQETTPALH
jgi:hypothetical protein